ncbi:MAG: hypothetical protein WBY44_36045, partial [Bryobacteraceae bacterium]
LGQVWGVSGGGANEESPVSMRAEGGFPTKNGKHISGAAVAQIVATNGVVTAPKPVKPNGAAHSHGMAGVK